MASYTPNYNLKKPADADSYDIADANGNMDLIDAALHSQNDHLRSLTTCLVENTNDNIGDVNTDAINRARGTLVRIDKARILNVLLNMKSITLASSTPLITFADGDKPSTAIFGVGQMLGASNNNGFIELYLGTNGVLTQNQFASQAITGNTYISLSLAWCVA